MDAKICGVSDLDTLNYIINHSNPPKFIGFIVNYTKSKRFIEFNILKKLIKLKKNKIKFVAVLVKPNNNILEKIKNLNFDYYQIYKLKPNELLKIKKNIVKKLYQQ